jgi:hypothetical protein
MEGMISNSVHGRRPARDLKWKNWYGFLLQTKLRPSRAEKSRAK